MTVIFESISVGSEARGKLPALRMTSHAAVTALGAQAFVELPLMMRAYETPRDVFDAPLPALRMRASDTATTALGASAWLELPRIGLAARETTLRPSVVVASMTMEPLVITAGDHGTSYIDADMSFAPTMRAVEAPLGQAAVWGRLDMRMLSFASSPAESTDNANFIFVSQSPGYVAITAAGDPSKLCIASERLAVGDVPRAHLIYVIAESLVLSGQFARLMTALQQLVDTFGLADDADAFLRLVVEDVLALADTGAGSMALAVQIVDALALSMDVDATQEAVAFVAAVLALGDNVAPLDLQALSDTVGLTDAILADWLVYMKALDAVRLDATPVNTLLVTVLAKDGLAVTDAGVWAAETRRVITEALGVSVTIGVGDEVYTAWVMNAETQAFSTYEDYPFNSYAAYGGGYIAAAADGIYELGGDTDDGEEIAARVRWGLTNLGTQRLKRMEMAYLGIATDGTMGLKVITTSPEGEKVAMHYKMNLRPSVDPKENRIKIGRGLESVYWGYELTNIEGADFDLHDFQLLPMVVSRRIRRE